VSENASTLVKSVTEKEEKATKSDKKRGKKRLKPSLECLNLE